MSPMLKEKIRESLFSVLPITVIVFLLCFSIAPIPNSMLLAFLLGAVLLILGMGLFTLGTETAMSSMGELVGASMTRSKKLRWVVLCGLVIGILITVAEPDLQVLARQVSTIPDFVLIGAVALGVGVFLVLALLRILFRISLSYLLIGCYILVFTLAAFVPKDFLAVAFDSGGVTTGPITVPFIIALGVGVSSIRSDKNTQDDSFGLVALCSIGPILMVLILGLLYQPTEASLGTAESWVAADSRELWGHFSSAFPEYLWEVLLALGPILLFFVVFQLFSPRLPRSRMIRIGVGTVYTYVGLVLFLTGVNVGFLPAGNYLGKQLASTDYGWVIIPVGMVIGFCIVAAEPAVHVLNKQVEQITDGVISPSAMNWCLSIGVSLSVGLSMVRVLTGISIFWFLIPGYILALGLTFFVPKIFTSVAFDSGGVASGAMTATFLLPFAMGACEALGGGAENVLADAFGIVSMVAMTPLITIQLMGLLYQRRQPKIPEIAIAVDDEVIELMVEEDAG